MINEAPKILVGIGNMLAIDNMTTLDNFFINWLILNNFELNLIFYSDYKHIAHLLWGGLTTDGFWYEDCFIKLSRIEGSDGLGCWEDGSNGGRDEDDCLTLTLRPMSVWFGFISRVLGKKNIN